MALPYYFCTREHACLRHWCTGLYLYIPRLRTHFLQNMHVSVKQLAMALHYYCCTRKHACLREKKALDLPHY